jgi:tetraacyldisaccharide 4'-kinase
MKIPEHPAAQAALGMAAVLYGAVIRARNRYYDRPGTVRRAGLPVISVGNLTVGGTGKTPVVSWIARRLLGEGLRPAVVSRGYRGSVGRGPLLVSDGRGPVCDAERCGDEPYVLARTLPGVAVVVGSDRVAGAEAARRAGAAIVVLDDAYQHRRLARDLDILLLDAGNPFGTGKLIPAGILREPLAGLSRASLVLITRSRVGEQFPAIERVLRRFNRSAPLLTAGHRRVGFVDRLGQPVARPDRAIAFCGIGRPQPFRTDLIEEGVELMDFRAYPDHHSYSDAELHALRESAERHRAELVTTEKDLVRLPHGTEWTGGVGLSALRIETEIHEPDLLLDAVLGIVGVERGARP